MHGNFPYVSVLLGPSGVHHLQLRSKTTIFIASLNNGRIIWSYKRTYRRRRQQQQQLDQNNFVNNKIDGKYYALFSVNRIPFTTCVVMVVVVVDVIAAIVVVVIAVVVASIVIAAARRQNSQDLICEKDEILSHSLSNSRFWTKHCCIGIGSDTVGRDVSHLLHQRPTVRKLTMHHLNWQMNGITITKTLKRKQFGKSVVRFKLFLLYPTHALWTKHANLSDYPHDKLVLGLVTIRKTNWY